MISKQAFMEPGRVTVTWEVLLDQELMSGKVNKCYRVIKNSMWPHVIKETPSYFSYIFELWMRTVKHENIAHESVTSKFQEMMCFLSCGRTTILHYSRVNVEWSLCNNQKGVAILLLKTLLSKLIITLRLTWKLIKYQNRKKKKKRLSWKYI